MCYGRLIRNRAKCLKCNEVIESKYRHNFVSCSCGAVSVDGGLAYIRRAGDFNSMEEMSVYDDHLLSFDVDWNNAKKIQERAQKTREKLLNDPKYAIRFAEMYMKMEEELKNE